MIARSMDAAGTRIRYCVGAEIGISQEIKSYERDCSTARSLDWTKSYGCSVKYGK